MKLSASDYLPIFSPEKVPILLEPGLFFVGKLSYLYVYQTGTTRYAVSPIPSKRSGAPSSKAR